MNDLLKPARVSADQVAIDNAVGFLADGMSDLADRLEATDACLLHPERALVSLRELHDLVLRGIEVAGRYQLMICERGA